MYVHWHNLQIYDGKIINNIKIVIFLQLDSASHELKK